MNYRLQRVVKAEPQKKSPETDAIVEHVHPINHQADEAEQSLRLSIETKATVKIGEDDRGGKKSGANRCE
jgi:hypothetical protein